MYKFVSILGKMFVEFYCDKIEDKIFVYRDKKRTNDTYQGNNNDR